MVQSGTIQEFLKSYEGLTASQVRAVAKEMLPDCSTTLSHLVQILAAGTSSRTTHISDEVLSRPDPYLKTMPDRKRTWCYDVLTILKEAPDLKWWLVTYRRIVDRATWRDTAQPYRLRQDQAKVIVRCSVLLLGTRMRERDIPRTPSGRMRTESE